MSLWDVFASMEILKSDLCNALEKCKVFLDFFEKKLLKST